MHEPSECLRHPGSEKKNVTRRAKGIATPFAIPSRNQFNDDIIKHSFHILTAKAATRVINAHYFPCPLFIVPRSFTLLASDLGGSHPRGANARTFSDDQIGIGWKCLQKCVRNKLSRVFGQPMRAVRGNLGNIILCF